VESTGRPRARRSRLLPLRPNTFLTQSLSVNAGNKGTLTRNDQTKSMLSRNEGTLGHATAALRSPFPDLVTTKTRSPIMVVSSWHSQSPPPFIHRAAGAIWLLVVLSAFILCLLLYKRAALHRCTSLAATCPGASATRYVIASMSTSSQRQQRSQPVKGVLGSVTKV
jgi:hypothetical protein